MEGLDFIFPILPPCLHFLFSLSSVEKRQGRGFRVETKMEFSKMIIIFFRGEYFSGVNIFKGEYFQGWIFSGVNICQGWIFLGDSKLRRDREGIQDYDKNGVFQDEVSDISLLRLLTYSDLFRKPTIMSGSQEKQNLWQLTIGSVVFEQWARVGFNCAFPKEDRGGVAGN